MKYPLIILLLIFSIVSCSDDSVNYVYTFKVKVTYLNGDTDTMNVDCDSYEGRKCYLYLSASSGNIISSGVTQPCLIKGCGLYQEAVSCGVRKFDLLKTEKFPVFKVK